MKKLLAILLSIAVSAAPVISRAAPPDAPASRAPTTLQEWIAAMGPDSLAAALGECIASVKTVGATTSVSLSDGTRTELVQSEQGKPESIKTFDRKGQLVQSVDAATGAPDHPDAPGALTQSDADQAKKRMETSAFLAMMRTQCHAMATNRMAPPVGEASLTQADLQGYLAIIKELNAAMLAKASAAMKAAHGPTPLP